MVFVDDSDDETPEPGARQGLDPSGLHVRLIHLTQGRRVGGLGQAVLVGPTTARGEWAVVMDGDLQHLQELVSQLVRTVELAVPRLLRKRPPAVLIGGLGGHYPAANLIAPLVSYAARFVIADRLIYQMETAS